MLFENNVIRERTINDAWRNALWCVARSLTQKDPNVYIIEKGSYEGQIRVQLPYVTIIIEEPGVRPFKFFVPENSGLAPPTDEERIYKYFYDYIVTDKPETSEDYTYGQFIAPQLEELIEKLNVSNGNTNQACANVGDEYSIDLKDPPCLRVVSFKVVPVEGKRTLQLSVFFRSWDAFTGFPENIGGLQLLKEYVLMHLTFECEDGPIVAYSDGLHIYEQYFPIVNPLNADKIPTDLTPYIIEAKKRLKDS